MKKEFFTEIFGLNFRVVGNRICLLTEGKPHWVKLGKMAAKAVARVIKNHTDYEDEWKKMAWADKQEMYKETCGS